MTKRLGPWEFRRAVYGARANECDSARYQPELGKLLVPLLIHNQLPSITRVVNRLTAMQNTTATPVPKPDGDIQLDADGQRIFVYETFTTAMPGFEVTAMQNTTTTPVSKPDDDIQFNADGQRIYVYGTFTTTDPGFKAYYPSDHPPWGRPDTTIVEAIRAGDLAKVSSLVAD
mgnify:CR=1 FL=1